MRCLNHTILLCEFLEVAKHLLKQFIHRLDSETEQIYVKKTYCGDSKNVLILEPKLQHFLLSLYPTVLGFYFEQFYKMHSN